MSYDISDTVNLFCSGEKKAHQMMSFLIDGAPGRT